MIAYTTLIKGARLIVETCMTVKENDSVLIIADDLHRKHAQALAGVAVAVGARAVIADVTPEVSAALASMKYPMEPAPHLAAAMVNSDVIIITTILEWANRFAHVDPVSAAVARGAKVASVEEGMGSWDLTIDDIKATTERAERIMAAMAGAKTVRVTSPAGTDVILSIEGRPPLKVVPVKDPGIMMGPIPLWGEVAYAAVEDKTNGVLVFDGVMLGVGVSGNLPEPIVVTCRDGRAVDIQGGAAADALKHAFSLSDENANIVAEFAIGTSEKEQYGSPSEKGMLSTVHFGLGDNAHCYPGGQSHSRTHLDGTSRDVTIIVDGKTIMEEGALVV
ncbi:MAG: aminopeptidase [Anaerolineales bacterium]|nr:aminopeptidase [Anaerolineales bacterium]